MLLLLHYCCCCSAAAAAAAIAAAAATSDPGQDNSLYPHSALARAWTCNHTIGTSQPTTAPARQDLFNQAYSLDSVAASLSLVQMLIRSSDKDLRQTGRMHPDCPCPPIAVLQPPR